MRKFAGSIFNKTNTQTMKNKLLFIIVTVVALIALPKINFGQAPNLGKVANFALFSSAGAVTSSSTLLYNTHVTGNIGAAPASISGFGNVDGVLYQGGTVFADATNDLLAAYTYINGLSSTNVLATPFGAGAVLTPGVYAVTNAAIWMTGNIILDAQNNPNAVFIFQLNGAFNTSANSKVNLVNGAKACNVFWKVEGAVNMAAGTKIMGTIIANNALINISAGDTLEGRALSINGAVSVNEALIFLPKGCGSPVLTGPPLPALLSTECYALFSSNGPVVDDFATFVIGDVGTNLGATLGYDPLKVTGTIHPIPDGSTAQCATDLLTVYTNLSTPALPYDIELLWPSLLGHDLVLTPHTYILNGATALTDTLYLNAEGNANAVFVFQIYGAFQTSTFSKIVLKNGAQAKNVYWKIDGAVNIGDYSIFNGSIVSAGAINLLTGVELNGRALTMVGALSTYAATVNTPSGMAGSAGIVMGNDTVCQGQTGVIYTVAPINNATSYNWTLPSGTTITSGANTNSITVDFDSNALSGTWNITVQGSSSCGSGTASTNFQVVVTATPQIASVPSQADCAGANTTAVNFSGGTAGTIYNWTNNNITIGLAANGTGNINSFIGLNNGIGPAIATITVTPSANGCPGLSTNFSITVKETPVMSQVQNQTLCENGTTTTVNFSGAPAGTSYDWVNNNPSIGLAANGNGNINAFNAADTGTAIITITPSNNGCNGASTSFLITVNQSPAMNTLTEQALCEDKETEAIIFSGTPGTTYNWVNSNPSIGLAANGDGNIESFITINNNQAPITAVITVTPTLNGCQGASNTTTITVDDCYDFNIPEGFSPNGDNINDLYVVRGIERYPSNSIVIFNRWGDKLFEASPYTNNWAGKTTTGLRVGGDELPVGTYFYVLYLGNGSSVYKGTIYLNR
jgi:gliding motility-associated-like protein